MPILCSFTDLHGVSLLLYKSPEEFWFKNFPYIYNKAIFSTSFTEDLFYQNLFTSFCKEHDVNLSLCDVLLTGFLEAPKLGIPVKLTKSLYEVFENIKYTYPILINNTSILTTDFCFSSSTLKPHRKSVEFGDVDEDNYYANLEIYPQIVTNEISTQIDLDSNIAFLMDEKSTLPSGLPLLFCGSRFSRTSIFAELDYLLMLNLIREPGVYEIKRDTFNVTILSALLNIYDRKTNIKPEIEKSATVISNPSALECMIKTDEGTSQLVQLEKDKTMVVPIPKGNRAKILLKSHLLGTVEHEIIGGDIGLIFDTRVEKRIVIQDVGIFSLGLKSFSRKV